MTIDYEQLKHLVQEAMFTGGGINEPSAPEDVPHRMPAADVTAVEGDERMNELYYMALDAREATERLIEKLDDPIFDDPYSDAFIATSALRRVLNRLEEDGAKPAPEDRVVSPPAWMQKYNASGLDGAGGGASTAAAAVSGIPGPPLQLEEEAEEDTTGLAGAEERAKKTGTGRQTKTSQVSAIRGAAKDISQGKELVNVDDKERQMITQLDSIFKTVADAEGVDLSVYRNEIKTFLQKIIRQATAQAGRT